MKKIINSIKPTYDNLLYVIGFLIFWTSIFVLLFGGEIHIGTNGHIEGLLVKLVKFIF